MKKLLFALSMAFCITSLAQTQHAPLAEQCKADYDLWHSTNKEEVRALPFTQLNEREVEMWECVRVRDALTGDTTRDYVGTSLLYGALMRQRYESFLRRHGEMHQFLDEDKAGIR